MTDPTDALEDLDGDGLTNFEVFQLGTGVVSVGLPRGGLRDSCG